MSTVSDDHLIPMYDEQRLWLLRGAMQAAPVYGLRAALTTAHRNITAGQPVLSIARLPVDDIVIEGDQMLRLWRNLGIVN